MTHVLLLCPNMIPSIILCGHSQLECLSMNGTIEYKWCRSGKVTDKLASWADTVFFVRSDSWLDVRLAEKLKDTGKYLIYVLDDDLLNVPDYIDSAKYYNRPEMQKNIRDVMAFCDCLLSPSKKLLEKYGESFSLTARIEEPSLVQRDTDKEYAFPLKIGFAGSIDRSRDIDELLTNAVGKLLQNYGDKISVEFFGARPEMVDKFGLKHIPYCDSYEDYLNTMRTLDWDIGLAPMPKTDFHSCKHYNKFIEYIGHGIAGVYSDVVPYNQVIRDGENGLICGNTEEEWYAALSRLIEDESLRKKISDNCLTEARESFTVGKTALELQKTLGNALDYKSGQGTIQGTSFLRFFFSCQRIEAGIKKYGLKTPVVVIKKLKAKLIG